MELQLDIEKLFDQIKDASPSDVDNVMKYLKQAGVIRGRSSEMKLRQLFEEKKAGKEDVDTTKLMDVLERTAADKSMTYEKMARNLIIAQAKEQAKEYVVETAKNISTKVTSVASNAAKTAKKHCCSCEIL